MRNGFNLQAMFTGIIESLGRVVSIENEGLNKHFRIECVWANELVLGQSVAHNGVCLTVTKFDSETYHVTAVDETLRRTNLGSLKMNDLVNLERCMPANGRFDGHIVQGHVDCTAVCTEVTALDGSTKYIFKHPNHPQYITVEKGSITINGVSLTVVDSTEDSFSVVIIPHTWSHTNFQYIKSGDEVNIEFDVVGKYVAKILGKN